MKLKQFIIFSVLALCSGAVTSCDDEKQDIINDIGISDEQHIANILCGQFNGSGAWLPCPDWVADCVPVIIPDGTFEEVNRYIIDESAVGWDFKFDRTGSFTIDIPANMLNPSRFVQGTWNVTGNHITLIGSLENKDVFKLEGEFINCIADYIKIKGNCSLLAKECHFEFHRNILPSGNYKSKLYNPDFKVVLYSTPEEDKYKWTLAGVEESPDCDILLQNPQAKYISPVTGRTMMLTKPFKLSFNKNGEYEFDGLDVFASYNGNWNLNDKNLELTFITEDPQKPGKTKKEKLLTGTIVEMKSYYLRIEVKSKILFDDEGENSHIMEFPFNLPDFDINDNLKQ